MGGKITYFNWDSFSCKKQTRLSKREIYWKQTWVTHRIKEEPKQLWRPQRIKSRTNLPESSLSVLISLLVSPRGERHRTSSSESYTFSFLAARKERVMSPHGATFKKNLKAVFWLAQFGLNACYWTNHNVQLDKIIKLDRGALRQRGRGVLWLETLPKHQD